MHCRIGRFVLDKEQKLTQVYEASFQSTYQCIHCGGNISLRRSKRGVPFFLHVTKRSPKAGHDFSEHQKIQRTLAQIFFEAGIEHRLEYSAVPDVRADVYVVLKRRGETTRLVIEIQRTRIAIEEVQKRMEAYARQGMKLLWIMPKRMQQYVQMRKWEQYIVARTNFVLFYDPGKAAYYYVSDYIKISSTRMRILYHRYDIRHLRLLTQDDCGLPFAKKTKIPRVSFVQELAAWRTRRQRARDRKDVLQQLLYEEQMTLADIPFVFYSQDSQFLCVDAASFFIQTTLYLLSVCKGMRNEDVFTYCVRKRLLSANDDARSFAAYMRHTKKIRSVCKDMNSTNG